MLPSASAAPRYSRAGAKVGRLLHRDLQLLHRAIHLALREEIDAAQERRHCLIAAGRAPRAPAGPSLPARADASAVFAVGRARSVGGSTAFITSGVSSSLRSKTGRLASMADTQLGRQRHQPSGLRRVSSRGAGDHAERSDDVSLRLAALHDGGAREVAARRQRGGVEHAMQHANFRRRSAAATCIGLTQQGTALLVGQDFQRRLHAFPRRRHSRAYTSIIADRRPLLTRGSIAGVSALLGIARRLRDQQIADGQAGSAFICQTSTLRSTDPIRLSLSATANRSR